MVMEMAYNFFKRSVASSLHFLSSSLLRKGKIIIVDISICFHQAKNLHNLNVGGSGQEFFGIFFVLQC